VTKALAVRPSATFVAEVTKRVMWGWCSKVLTEQQVVPGEARGMVVKAV